jgi:hypothetical protein
VIDCVSGALVAIHVEAITHDHTDGAICLVIPPAKAEKKRMKQEAEAAKKRAEEEAAAANRNPATSAKAASAANPSSGGRDRGTSMDSLLPSLHPSDIPRKSFIPIFQFIHHIHVAPRLQAQLPDWEVVLPSDTQPSLPSRARSIQQSARGVRTMSLSMDDLYDDDDEEEEEDASAA